MNIDTDPKKIEEIVTRSVDTIYPSKEAFVEALTSGKQLTIYNGIDPTAPYVHLGHATNYLILERLHKLGHKIIILVGSFTAMIGDPSDKGAARKRLTKEEVEENLKTFKEQIGKILDFDNKENPIEFKQNSDWLASLTFEDAVDLASNFTVQRMLERDAFEKRIKEEKPLYVHEFFYPLMQGYDSVAMDVDVEIGGTDQTFNMLAGRTLLKRYKDKEKFVIATTLLENPVTGEKLMSKSLGTGIGLNEEPNEMYGKVMAIADEGVVQVFRDCTRMSLEEVAAIEKRYADGENPKVLKEELAKEIVTMYHGEGAAEAAAQEFKNVFGGNSMPTEIPEKEISEEKMPIIDLLCETELTASKSEARRLIDQGGVKINQEVVESTDHEVQIVNDLILQVGKRRFIRIKKG